MPSINLRQIALAAGCSRTTVSLALRNHPRIPPKTRRMIADLAVKMGYTRDPMMSSLMTRMRAAPQNRAVEKLAYVTWWNTPESKAQAPRDTLGYDAACRRAKELGYEVEEFWAKQPGLSVARLNKILHTRAIRGVLLGTLPRPLGHVRLDFSRLATVAIGYTVANHGIHHVGTDHFQGMTLSTRQLKHRGYSRIAFTSLTDQSERANHGWLSGYLNFQYRIARDQRIPPLLVSQWDKKKFAVWLEKHKPDAIISNIPDPLTSVRQLGYKVPEDVAFATLDRIHPSIPHAGIDQVRTQVNMAAVELLVSQLENNQFGPAQFPKTLHIDGVWSDGPTVAEGKRTR